METAKEQLARYRQDMGPNSWTDFCPFCNKPANLYTNRDGDVLCELDGSGCWHLHTDGPVFGWHGHPPPEPTVTLPARLVAAALNALEELVAEHEAEPQDHDGPWYGRHDTGGIVLARQALDLIRRP